MLQLFRENILCPQELHCALVFCLILKLGKSSIWIDPAVDCFVAKFYLKKKKKREREEKVSFV